MVLPFKSSPAFKAVANDLGHGRIDVLGNYITVEIALENKTIEKMQVQPMYYLDLRVGDNTETYLGWKEDNPNSNYGYHVHELCTVELESEITDLSNKYMVKSIEFIAD